MEPTVVASPVIKVAAICGSVRKASFNRGLLRSAIEICKESVEGVQIELIDVSPLPMINTDLEVDGRFPPAVEAFRQKVLEADSVLFASPEYNYSVAHQIESIPKMLDQIGIRNFHNNEHLLERFSRVHAAESYMQTHVKRKLSTQSSGYMT